MMALVTGFFDLVSRQNEGSAQAAEHLSSEIRTSQLCEYMYFILFGDFSHFFFFFLPVFTKEKVIY